MYFRENSKGLLSIVSIKSSPNAFASFLWLYLSPLSSQANFPSQIKKEI
jgi:hypothetical protein